MSLLAEVYVAADDLALTPTIRAVPNADIEFERGSVTDPERPPLFVRVTSDEFESFERALADDWTVTDATLLEATDDRRFYRLSHTERSITLYPLYAGVDGALLAGRAADAGWLLRMRFPNRDALIAFRDACQHRAVSFRLERLVRSGEQTAASEYGLTSAQHETLLVALQSGYFDVPRAISQTELAAELGISKSALSQRLRRGTATLLDATLLTNEESTPSLGSDSDV